MIERLLPAGPHHRVRVRCTERADGDFRIDQPPVALAARRAAVARLPWTWLTQEHGGGVVEVTGPGMGAGARADASVTAVVGAVLAIQTADCAPVVFCADGVVAAVHAGWRGVVAGVIPRTLEHMARHGDSPVHAVLGPCIGPASYAFGSDDLDAVVAVCGEAARAVTHGGDPALDLAGAVEAQCLDHGVATFERCIASVEIDTAAPQWFSHRTRADPERQVTVAWLEDR